MARPFSTSLDIMNRGLQRLGATRIASLTEASRNASAVTFCYDKLRVAELRRNVWRFATRKAVLRPLDTTTMSVTFAAWSSTVSYVLGSVVTYNGIVYYAPAAIAAGGASPDQNSAWEQYFGPTTAQPWVSGQGYYTGELVYYPSTSPTSVYVSLTSANMDTPGVSPAWDTTVTYSKGQTVVGSDLNTYQSLVDLNLAHDPTLTSGVDWELIATLTTQTDVMTGQNWLNLGSATASALEIVWPVGTGPVAQTDTRNVFLLPNGFLREAPSGPKQGSTSYLGTPRGGLYNDWQFEGDFITSTMTDPLILRFVADIADVTEMDPMFCEGLACRIAEEVCEELTQSDQKLTIMAGMYKGFMTEARVVNGIETGATEPPLDDYIACRA